MQRKVFLLTSRSLPLSLNSTYVHVARNRGFIERDDIMHPLLLFFILYDICIHSK